ncbi:MAG: polysaccharide biosynthesis/export family protein [Gemmatimonadales bacterium]
MNLRSTLVLVLLTAPVSAQEQRGIVATDAARYRLQAGDVIRIEVWNRPEFTGQFQIDEGGFIHYPALGTLSVGDLNIGQLRDSIRTALEEIFNRPFVTITPLFRMAVIGHVQRPGLYTVDPTLTVFDMVAMAGGPSAAGDMNKISLFRGGAEREVAFEQEGIRGRTLSELGIRSGDQIFVNRRRITAQDILFGLQVVQLLVSVAILIRQ